jgi:hypothetical protein
MRILLIICLMATAWPGTATAQNSALNTAEAHYQQGMRELETEQYDAALLEFEQARQIDKDYALAYVGIGLIHHANSDFETAMKSLDTALRRDKKCYQAHLAKGRVYLARRPAKNWRKDAVESFERVQKQQPGHPEAAWLIARAWYLDGELEKAEKQFRDIIQAGGPFAEQANRQRLLLDKLKVVDPVSDYGKDLMMSDAVTRAELAVLLVEELELLKLVEQRDRQRPEPRDFQAPDDYVRDGQAVDAALMAADAQSHWARGWIAMLLDQGVMEKFADDNFLPDAPITRTNFAMALQNVYVLIMDEPTLTTKYLGGRSIFSDVPSAHYAYNAIALCVSMGFLQADPSNGAFGLEEPVAGVDALYVLQDMRRLMQNMF